MGEFQITIESPDGTYEKVSTPMGDPVTSAVESAFTLVEGLSAFTVIDSLMEIRTFALSCGYPWTDGERRSTTIGEGDETITASVLYLENPWMLL